MRVEEAVQTLTDIKNEAENGVCYVTENDVNVLRMAIKSLEAWSKIKKETTNWHNIKLTIDQYEFLDIVEPYLAEVEE